MDTQIAIGVTDATPGGALASVRDVNCHLTCSVCRGYLIDATTITECLHSFCRSCVIGHVNEHHTCPSCRVALSSTKPFSQLRRDYTLQTIVYKMVPRLARDELERRQKFAQQKGDKMHADTDERYLESFIAPDDPISLSLEYADANCAFGLRQRFGVALSKQSDDDHERRRYFRCPANLPVGHLVKFLRSKFNVLDADEHKLEILYNGHPLAAEYRLADVAYIFSWKQMEPLRLWYRISSISAPEGAVGASQSAQVTQRAPTPATPRKTPKKRANKLKKAKCGPLVDITSKRSWQSDTNQRPAKRRKRAPPADAAAAAHKAPPATPDEDDVKLSSLLPDASNAPQTTVEQSLPVCDPEVIADQANQAEEAPDNNNKTNAIFDDARPAEFSCSTPIPTPDQAEAPGSKVKSTTWLPKAVFDLDDRDLFAKRLQKITKEEPATEEDTVKPELPDEPEAPEVSVNDAPRTPPMAQKDEPMELSPSSPLDPLRICVTPEPAAAPAAASEATSDQVHDSIGALDLSGSSKGSDCDAASPQPSPGTSTTSAVAKSGPHPFFMTPMFQKTKTQPKAQPMKKPAALNSNGTSPRMIKSPLWNLLNHSMNHGAQFEPPPSPHKTLFDFFKSNPFLFRPAVPSPAGGHHQAQKSPVSKGGTSKSKNKLPSPKSI